MKRRREGAPEKRKGSRQKRVRAVVRSEDREGGCK